MYRSTLAMATALCALLWATSVASQNVLPRPEAAFAGKAGRTVQDSKPDFPKEAQAPAGAPNVLVIMTDDVGFGASSPFGGPIPTPTFDRLAASGLRYNNFHTTALCSPTRAALITGRNHHSAASGVIMEFGTGYPGYHTLMPKSVGTIAEVLKQNGYNTSWFGKNHNVPDWHSSQAGPFDLWPTGLGFEHFFGFLGGDTDQWHSAVFEGTKPIELEEQSGPNPKHFDAVMADRAIDYLRMQHAMAPNKPFFLYYATGTAHGPNHAPKEWIAKFKGRFDQGWDRMREQTFARQKQLGIIPRDTKLTARPDQIPAWDSLNADQKRLYARMMEVYAAALAHADHEIGRVIATVEELGELDNTLIIFIQGDNGASGEGTLQGLSNEVGVAGNLVPESLDFLVSSIDELGGPLHYNLYPVGWAHAMNTPFQWTKQVASHFGGTRNGLVMSWPARINDKGGIRSQFHHVVDVVPTVLETIGLSFPDELNGVKQKPIEGVSMVYTLANPQAASTRRTLYFEMLGNRGIFHEGWMASSTPLRLPWAPPGAAPNPDDFKWELYDVSKDFAQAHNVVAQYPEKLKELQAIFDREARKYDVYPLQTSFADRAAPTIRPSLTRGRNAFTYYAGQVRIPEGTAPNTKNRSFALNAEVEIPAEGANGVIATQGGRFGGWGLLLLDGKPMFAQAFSNQAQHKYRIASSERLTAGKHVVRFEFKYDGGGIGKGGTGTLLVDGKPVAQGRVDRTTMLRFSLDETFDVGRDTGTPVIEDYDSMMPFPFSAKLDRFTIELQ